MLGTPVPLPRVGSSHRGSRWARCDSRGKAGRPQRVTSARAGLALLADLQVALGVWADLEDHRPVALDVATRHVGPVGNDRVVLHDLSAADVVPVAAEERRWPL